VAVAGKDRLLLFVSDVNHPSDLLAENYSSFVIEVAIDAKQSYVPGPENVISSHP